MMQLHWIDYAIITVVGLSMLTGLFRGFLKELIALCVWILAIWLAYHYTSALDPWLQHYIQDKTARMVVGFIAILLMTIIAGGIFNALLSFILRRTGLSGTDRLLGMLFGFVRGVFIVALVLAGVKITSATGRDYTNNSVLYPKFDPLVNWLYGHMQGVIQHVNVLDKTGQGMHLDTKDLKPGTKEASPELKDTIPDFKDLKPHASLNRPGDINAQL